MVLSAMSRHDAVLKILSQAMALTWAEAVSAHQTALLSPCS